MTTARAILAVWSHDASRCAGLLEDQETGNWIALLGNPARADLRALDGDRLLARLLAEFRKQGADFAGSLSPPFALLLGDGATGDVQALVDRCGLQHLYFGGREQAWVSSSSLALAPAIGAALDRTALTEWVTIGHFLSNRTFVRGVLKLSGGERLLFRSGRDPERCAAPPARSVESSARAAGSTYRGAFEASLHAAGSDHGLSNELTGGLDSRLVLAGLIQARERSLSWTFGDPLCPDIRTVERLRRRVPFPHFVVPIDSSIADGIVDDVEEMHAVSEGEVNALEYAPLLAAFRGLEGRRTTSLSGAGGEIGRGFYYRALQSADPRVRGVPLGGLVDRVSRNASAIAAGCREDVMPDPRAPVARALEELIESSPGTSPEEILDDIYLRARMQRFAGRNFTTTGLYCRQGLPYFGNALLDVLDALPSSEKAGGRLMQQTLMEISPALASEPLFSGRPLASSPAPATVPWKAVLSHDRFRSYVRDLLCSSSTRIREVFPPPRLEGLVDEALAGGQQYPLGLLITLELTLRRLASLGTDPHLVP